MSRLLVTGATGFLGRHLQKILQVSEHAKDLVLVSSSDYDLTDFNAVNRMLRDIRPTSIIHLAAYSGGIGANKEKPADFFFQNAMFSTLIFEAARRNGVEKLIYPIGGCSYPANARSPINEDCMWDGFPQPESAGYSIAKKMGLAAAIMYQTQYGLNSTVLVPGNMYGEFDNFRTGESHVIPAMIRRYHETKLRGEESITFWGDGSPIRDFVYAGDVAKLIPHFLDNDLGIGPFNLSSGVPTNIKHLAELVGKKVGWTGEIQWDTSKPNGQAEKLFDVSRLNKLGLNCPTDLDQGLQKTIDWFIQHYADQSDGIRL